MNASPKVKDTWYHVLNVSYVVFDGTVTALLDSYAASKTEAAAAGITSSRALHPIATLTSIRLRLKHQRYN